MEMSFVHWLQSIESFLLKWRGGITRLVCKQIQGCLCHASTKVSNFEKDSIIHLHLKSQIKLREGHCAMIL